MAEAKNKRRRYRAQLRRAMIRESVPKAPGSPADSTNKAIDPVRGHADVVEPQSDGNRPQSARRVHTQEVVTTSAHLDDSPSSGSPRAESRARAGDADASGAPAQSSPNPTTRARSTPTQGTGRVAMPDEPENGTGGSVDADVSGPADPSSSKSSGSSRRASDPGASTGPASAPVRSEPARSLIDGGEHYRGATETDVVDAWREMRRQFGMNTQNKLKARTAMRDWLRSKRNLSPESVVWYGDFVAVRSCEVRTRQPERARREDGWFLAVDPNRSGYRDSHIFDEAFVARSTLTPGAVEDLLAPAWISEATRLGEAEKAGKGQARPFVPGSIDDLTADMLEKGEVA